MLYYPVPQSNVDLGANSRAHIVGQVDVILQVRVNSKTAKNVKHVRTLN